MTTLLFLTAGPYFFAHLKTVRSRYEALSQHFDGFILSFVSRKEFRRVSIGSFELVGHHISRRTYQKLPLRLLIRVGFVLFSAMKLHFFRRRVDLIIAYEPLVTGPMAWLLSRITGAPFVVEINNDFQNVANWNREALDLFTSVKRRYVGFVIPFLVNRADGVRLLYPSQLSGLRALRQRGTYHCFHDFVATSLFDKGAPWNESERRILFLGHPWYVKGIDLLLHAFNELSPDYPEWTLRIVGHLPEKERYRDLYAGNPKVEILSAVMGDDVIPLMAACSIFVLPSRSEGMPRVILEAMASGKLVIASRVGGIPHYLRHGETALLFDPEDVDGLRRVLREALANQDYAREIAERGREYVAARLSDRCYIRAFRRMVADLEVRHSSP